MQADMFTSEESTGSGAAARQPRSKVATLAHLELLSLLASRSDNSVRQQCSAVVGV